MSEVLLKDILEDSELGQRIDAWFATQGTKAYQEGDKIKLVDIKGKEEGPYSAEELIEEYNFESANSKVPKRCVE